MDQTGHDTGTCIPFDLGVFSVKDGMLHLITTGTLWPIIIKLLHYLHVRLSCSMYDPSVVPDEQQTVDGVNRRCWSSGLMFSSCSCNANEGHNWSFAAALAEETGPSGFLVSRLVGTFNDVAPYTVRNQGFCWCASIFDKSRSYKTVCSSIAQGNN